MMAVGLIILIVCLLLDVVFRLPAAGYLIHPEWCGLFFCYSVFRLSLGRVIALLFVYSVMVCIIGSKGFSAVFLPWFVVLCAVRYFRARFLVENIVYQPVWVFFILSAVSILIILASSGHLLWEQWWGELSATALNSLVSAILCLSLYHLWEILFRLAQRGEYYDDKGYSGLPVVKGKPPSDILL